MGLAEAAIVSSVVIFALHLWGVGQKLKVFEIEQVAATICHDPKSIEYLCGPDDMEVNQLQTKLKHDWETRGEERLYRVYGKRSNAPAPVPPTNDEEDSHVIDDG